ncbi:hypothetical protein BJ138DRAFT_1158836 [Hygrophoropsis aurantiaca]|uniref:Uncharacterized protein n=1 Tax=Hygrophoropsis aurantiaca TaxID=72124 RepID=A0ACB8A5H7_9AGAM|nr:hypothetical protein BJ138DRAFT_1158836 [Hygrophoropsis aurantiaca]
MVLKVTEPSSMQPSTDAGTESSDHDSDLYIHPSPDVLNPQTSTTPSASLSIDDLPDPNNAAAQLHQLISRVIHTRETEEKILGERYQASLSHLAELDKAFSSAKEKAKLANNRVFAVRREITLLEDRECTAADVQQASEYLNFVEEEKSWMTAYVNIASSLPDKAFLDVSQMFCFSVFLHGLRTEPTTDSEFKSNIVSNIPRFRRWNRSLQWHALHRKRPTLKRSPPSIELKLVIFSATYMESLSKRQRKCASSLSRVLHYSLPNFPSSENLVGPCEERSLLMWELCAFLFTMQETSSGMLYM